MKLLHMAQETHAHNPDIHAYDHVCSHIMNHTWLFDPHMFTVRVYNKKHIQDPVDVFAQSRIYTSYVEVLQQECTSMQQETGLSTQLDDNSIESLYDVRKYVCGSDAPPRPELPLVIRALEDLLKDLGQRVAKKGGHRAMLYGVNGDMDTELFVHDVAEAKDQVEVSCFILRPTHLHLTAACELCKYSNTVRACNSYIFVRTGSQ